MAAVRAIWRAAATRKNRPSWRWFPAPRPTITVMSLTVRGGDRQPRHLHRLEPSGPAPSRQAPSARPHSRTTAIQFQPQTELRRIQPVQLRPRRRSKCSWLRPPGRPSPPRRTPPPSPAARPPEGKEGTSARNRGTASGEAAGAAPKSTVSYQHLRHHLHHTPHQRQGRRQRQHRSAVSTKEAIPPSPAGGTPPR